MTDTPQPKFGTHPTGEPPHCALDAEFEGHFVWEHDCFEYQFISTDHLHSIEVPSRTSCHLRMGGNGWTIVQEDPLTIAPSILCDRCKTHGFFENGTWREC
jgi:hypothetical protein